MKTWEQLRNQAADEYSDAQDDSDEYFGFHSFIAGANWERERSKKLLIEALRFYAHGKNWSEIGKGCYADIGATARQALQEQGGGV